MNVTVIQCLHPSYFQVGKPVRTMDSHSVLCLGGGHFLQGWAYQSTFQDSERAQHESLSHHFSSLIESQGDYDQGMLSYLLW